MKETTEILDFKVTQIKNPDNSKELSLTTNPCRPEDVEYFQEQFKQETSQIPKTEVGTKLTYFENETIHWKPTNALRTGGCYVEIKAFSSGKAQYLYRIGPGCVVVAEKPRRDFQDGEIFSYPFPVLTIVKDLNTVFNSFTPELITLKPNTFLIKVAHVTFTRSSINAYEKYLKYDASEVLYIGILDDSSIFTYKYKGGEYKEIQVADLGLFQKRIISEGESPSNKEAANDLEKARINDFRSCLFDPA